MGIWYGVASVEFTWPRPSRWALGGRVASWIMHVDPHDYNNTTERTRNDLGAHWVTRTVTRTDRPSFTPTERNTLA